MTEAPPGVLLSNAAYQELIGALTAALMFFTDDTLSYYSYIRMQYEDGFVGLNEDDTASLHAILEEVLHTNGLVSAEDNTVGPPWVRTVRRIVDALARVNELSPRILTGRVYDPDADPPQRYADDQDPLNANSSTRSVAWPSLYPKDSPMLQTLGLVPRENL